MGRRYYHNQGIKSTNQLRNTLLGLMLIFFIGFFIHRLSFTTTSKSIDDENSLSLDLSTQEQITKPAPEITTPMPWPEYGYSGYAVPDINLFAVSDSAEQAVPIASLTKVITVLAILDKYPLELGEQGPLITLTQSDVDLFYMYLSKDGVVVPVEAGAQISLYQALQAIILVSANNMSDTAARWAFGSDEKYLEYANDMLKGLGLSKTVTADASGFSPNSVSTPREMAKLGYLYMQNPILREIAMQEGAVIPVAGAIRNSNSFANSDGVYGIKIGYTEEAMRTYLVADLGHKNGITDGISIAVVLGADDFITAARDARAILEAGNNGYIYD